MRIKFGYMALGIVLLICVVLLFMAGFYPRTHEGMTADERTDTRKRIIEKIKIAITTNESLKTLVTSGPFNIFDVKNRIIVSPNAYPALMSDINSYATITQENKDIINAVINETNKLSNLSYANDIKKICNYIKTNNMGNIPLCGTYTSNTNKNTKNCGLLSRYFTNYASTKFADVNIGTNNTLDGPNASILSPLYATLIEFITFEKITV